MKPSKRCEYGICAAVRLARVHKGPYLQSREIADAEELPAKFLEAVLLQMRAAGILESKVGVGGGYRLARPPTDILLADIVRALEPPGRKVIPISERPVTVGQVALMVLAERLDQAFEEALGYVTLAELLTLVERQEQALPALTYDI